MCGRLACGSAAALQPQFTMSCLSSVFAVLNPRLFTWDRAAVPVTGWACRYEGLSYGGNDKENMIAYIKRQKEHHGKETFFDEIRRVLAENGNPHQ